MALTVVGRDRFLASGHPDPRDPRLRRRGRPPLLGLIESTDAGRPWSSISLLGDADFHALAAARGTSSATTRQGDGCGYQRRPLVGDTFVGAAAGLGRRAGRSVADGRPRRGRQSQPERRWRPLVVARGRPLLARCSCGCDRTRRVHCGGRLRTARSIKGARTASGSSVRHWEASLRRSSWMDPSFMSPWRVGVSCAQTTRGGRGDCATGLALSPEMRSDRSFTAGSAITVEGEAGSLPCFHAAVEM